MIIRNLLVVACFMVLGACSAPYSYPLPSGYDNQTADTTGSNVEEGVKYPNMGFMHVAEDDGNLLNLWDATARDLISKLEKDAIISRTSGNIALATPKDLDTRKSSAVALYDHFDYALRTALLNKGYKLSDAGDASVVLYSYAKLYEPPKSKDEELVEEEADPRGMDKFVLSITTAPMPTKIKKDTVIPSGVSGTYTLPAYSI